jgi:hypothetical protein
MRNPCLIRTTRPLSIGQIRVGDARTDCAQRWGAEMGNALVSIGWVEYADES